MWMKNFIEYLNILYNKLDLVCEEKRGGGGKWAAVALFGWLKRFRSACFQMWGGGSFLLHEVLFYF